MKKIIILLILASSIAFAQWNGVTNKQVREQDMFGPLFDQALDSANISSGSVSDSVIFPYETTAWDKDASDDVTIAGTQTITGQKNFTGTVKVGSDTVISLGRFGISNVRTAIYIEKPYVIGNKTNIFQVKHPLPTVPDWSMSLRDWTFNDTVGHGLYLSQNDDGNKDIPQFGLAFEAPYRDSDTSTIYESFWFFNDLPSPNTTYAVRPFSLNVTQNDNGTFESLISAYVERFWIYDYSGTVPYVKINGDRAHYYIPIRTELTASDTDHITLNGAAQNNFIHWSDGTPNWRLGTDGVGNFRLYYGNDLNTAVNPGVERIRFGTDYTYSKPFMVDDNFSAFDGVLLSAGDGNGSMRISGIFGIDQAQTWFRNYAQNLIRAKIDDSGLIINNLTGSAPTDGVNYYSTDLSAGNTIPSYYTEGTGVITALGNIVNRYNGTLRYIPSSTTDDEWVKDSGIQLFIDSLYRSNDTIYFVQEDGSKLYFVDNNTGGAGTNYADSLRIGSTKYDADLFTRSNNAETISANWVNTANPWAENEIVSSMATEAEANLWSYRSKDSSTVTVTGNGKFLMGNVAAGWYQGTTQQAKDTLGVTALERAMPDTLTYTFSLMDTTVVGAYPGWKVPFNITVIEVAAYTDANTCTFNLEERAETTPNTAGTDVMTSDLVADNDQQETTTFSNAILDKNDWLVLTISATGDVEIFSATVTYVKTN